jgi:hypothetical protein
MQLEVQTRREIGVQQGRRDPISAELCGITAGVWVGTGVSTLVIEILLMFALFLLNYESHGESSYSIPLTYLLQYF